jgi:gamma-glutamyltranspeptidase/glutathione hydrolase
MGQLSVAVNCYVYGMDPQEALDQPRYFPKGGKVLVESGIGDAIRQGLIAKGHVLEATPEPLGGGQAIAIDHARGLLIGGSDPRKDGFALGY